MLKKQRALFLSGVLTVYLCACANTAQSPSSYSGFLKDYSGLQLVQLGKARFISSKLNPNNYDAVLIEPVMYYPVPRPNEKVSGETLKAVADYIDYSLRTKLGEKVSLAKRPGPGVVRLRVAVTAVGSKEEGLKPYQYIPVAFIAATAKNALVGAPKVATLSVEAEASDSITGERLAASVRSAQGAKLNNEAVQPSDRVTLTALRPLIDKGIQDVITELPKYIKNNSDRT